MIAPQIGQDEADIPGGWPRAFYIGSDGKRKYTQWTSAHAASQIMSCHSDKIYTAGKTFACSSCGQIMERGLLLADVDPYEGQVGSPICYRCCTFAFKHCPDFMEKPDRGWFVSRSPVDYYETDETGCLQVSARGQRRRRTTREDIIAEVAAGRLWLTEDSVVDHVVKRPLNWHPYARR